MMLNKTYVMSLINQSETMQDNRQIVYLFALHNFYLLVLLFLLEQFHKIISCKINSR